MVEGDVVPDTRGRRQPTGNLRCQTGKRIGRSRSRSVRVGHSRAAQPRECRARILLNAFGQVNRMQAIDAQQQDPIDHERLIGGRDGALARVELRLS